MRLAEDLGVEQWNAVVETNLTGAFLCTQAAFRIMKRQSPHGGRIVHSGTYDELLRNANSITGAYLSGKESIEIPAIRRPADHRRQLTIVGAREHNLRDIDVSFPLGVLTSVTGVSGSGKSTLVNDILASVLANKLNGARQVPGRHTRVTGLDRVDKLVRVERHNSK